MTIPVLPAYEVAADGGRGAEIFINFDMVRKFRPLPTDGDGEERIFVISYSNGDTEQVFLSIGLLTELLDIEDDE